MDRYVPLFVDPSVLKILVIGGGKVALRKCQHFKGADITVMTDNAETHDHKMINRKADVGAVTKIMKDFDIIVASTNDKELNQKITEAAIAEGVMVNSAHGGGTVLIPSVLERDRYVIAASTEGRVPAFLPFLIRELDILLDERFDMMFDVLFEIRNRIKDKGTQQQRSEHLKAVSLDPEVRDHIERRDMTSAVRRAIDLGVRE